jgi:hypothetical protein
MAELRIPIYLDKTQAKKDAEAFSQELIKIFRGADSVAVASARQVQQTKQQLDKELAASLKAQAKADTDYRLNELNKLKDAIKSRYQSEDEAAKNVAASIRNQAKADADARTNELKRLQESIKARYKLQDDEARRVAQTEKALADEHLRHLHEATKGYSNMSLSVADFIKGAAGLSGVGAALGGIADRSRQTADYMHGISAEFKQLQAELQQVAALTGKSNSNEFTVAQAKAAAAAGLKPAEFVRAQEEFQSRAGAYVGDAENPIAKLNTQQGEQFQAQLATFAKARGIAPSEIMSLGGGLLQNAKGPTTPDELMKQLGGVFQTLEKAPTPVAQLLPQMSRLMSQNFSPDKAAQSLAIMSEAMPGEEQTGVENTYKALLEAQLKGKGDTLGLAKGMNPAQMIEAGSRTLAAKAANGEDLDKLLSDYAPDIRERRGILGFINRGVNAKGFERTQGYLDNTPADFVKRSINDYMGSDAGQRARNDAELAAAQAEQAAKLAPVENVREKARVQLTKEGRFAQNGWLDWFRNGVGRLTGVDANEQAVNERAFDIAQRQNGTMPNAADEIPFVRSVAGNQRVMGAAATQSTANDMILQELQKQTAILQGKGMQGDPIARGPVQAIAAPPPMPATRM